MNRAGLPPRLVALTPGELDDRSGRRFSGVVRAAVEAGLRGVLLREPHLTDRAWLDLALRLAEILRTTTRDGEGWFGVHDRAHLAAACGAQAMHLGFRSLAPSELEDWIGPEIAIGLSTHAADDPARWIGAHYLFHGPVHATPSKSGLLEPIGFEGLARAVKLATVPVWGIGGLRPEHCAAIKETGAHGVVARASVLGAADVRAAVKAWRAALEASFGEDAA